MEPPAEPSLGQSRSGTSVVFENTALQHWRQATRLPAGSNLGQRLRKPPDASGVCGIFNPPVSSRDFDKLYLCSLGRTAMGVLFVEGMLLSKYKVILWYRMCLFKVHLHPTMGAPTRQLLIWPGAGWYPGLDFPELGGGGSGHSPIDGQGSPRWPHCSNPEPSHPHGATSHSYFSRAENPCPAGNLVTVGLFHGARGTSFPIPVPVSLTSPSLRFVFCGITLCKMRWLVWRCQILQSRNQVLCKI